jgi:hypothetical protein
METLFLKVFQEYPELFTITRDHERKGTICYGEKVYNTSNFLCSLLWVYKYYFNKKIVLFVPKQIDINAMMTTFNQLHGGDYFSEITVFNGYIESFDVQMVDGIVIYAYADIIFNEHVNIKRLNTQIKNSLKRNKILTLSCSSLKPFQLSSLDTFETFRFDKNSFFDYSCIDIFDNDQEILDENIDALVDFLELEKNKKIYLSLNLPNNVLKRIESLIKDKDIEISRKEKGISSGIVINSPKTTEKAFLKENYDIYIFLFPYFDKPYDIVPYIKDTFGRTCEIYIDASCLENVNKCLQFINNENVKRKIIKESPMEYEKISKMNIMDPIVISESYYRFDAPENITTMNLSNLSKLDYDVIRNFVKLKLNLREITAKTCQLSTPSSPKDRSKKLNSLSNKISSYNYRCDVTCELFRDYTIGVVVWSELKYNKMEPGNYVYQTTSGMWKYTLIS